MALENLLPLQSYMNRITAIILLFCLSCQLVLKLSIIAWFEINQEYIAATLCENRQKPELVCCGKCVLTKKLDKADGLDKNSQSTKNSTNKEDLKSMVSFVLPEKITSPAKPENSSTSAQNAGNNHLLGIIFCNDIFHPPACAFG